MLPSIEDIIVQRRRLSAEYEANKGTTKKLSHPQSNFRPVGTSNTTTSSSNHGLVYKGLKYPGPLPPIQEINNKNRITFESTSKQYLNNEPSERLDDSCSSPKIAMKLPSVEDIVARRRKLPVDNTSYSQPDETSNTLEEVEEPVAPELVRALEAVGWCPTPRGSTPRKRSLDNLSLPDEILLDELLSNERHYDIDLLQIDEVEIDKGSLPIERDSKISTSRAQPLGPLVAIEANPVQKSLSKSYNSPEAADKFKIKEQVESTQLSSNKTSETVAQGWRKKTDLNEERQDLGYTFDHEEQEKNFLSIFPRRDCSSIGLQNQKRCTGLGLRRHMVLVPPPKRRVDLSELYVNEVVLVKRDRSVWVFAQLKMLTHRGIKAWVPSVQLYINIPIEIMYTHLRKVEDDEELKGLPEFVACAILGDDDNNKGQRIPLPTTFDRGKNFRMISEKLPKRQNQLHLVRPSHLAHRTLHLPFESTLPCTICFRLMPLMDAHKPWDCEHSCHLFCYQLVLQSANSNSCITCSVGKIWDWNTINCQCGFLGFMQKRADDLESLPMCPSCLKPSPILNLYRPSLNSESKLAFQSSVPITNSNTNLESLMASPFQGSTTLEEWNSLPKLSRRAINLEEMEWRHVNCECGLRGMIRTSVDSSKSLMCPACFNLVKEWSIPNEDDLLKALLGYTPTDSPTFSSTSSSQSSSPLSCDGRSSSNIVHTVSYDFSLFDGVKHLESCPSTLLTPNNTPLSIQSDLSPVLCDQSENSSYMSCSSSSQNNSPPSSSPREPMYISPSLVSSSMPTLSTSLSGPLINQSLTSSRNKPTIHTFGPVDCSNKELKSSHITVLPSPRTPLGHSSRKPTISPTTSAKPLHLFQSTTRLQLPTDSLAFRVTRSQIKKQMEEQAKKQIAQVLKTKLVETEPMQSISAIASNQDTASNSECMWMAPLESFAEGETSEQSMQNPLDATSESGKLVHKRPLSIVPKISLSTDTLSMFVTPEQIKLMMMEEEMKQMSDPRSIKNQSLPFIQPSPITLKRSSSTDSISIEMTPQLIKQMMMNEELQQQEQDPKSLRPTPMFPHPKLSNPPMQTGHLPTDSISMWMTAAKIKNITMKKQRQKEPLSKSTRQNLPTDSASLWLTPSKIKQMVMMEEEICDHKQDRPLKLGEELRRPISTIEEEPYDLGEEESELIKQMVIEEELQHQGQDSTPSTKQVASTYMHSQPTYLKQTSQERPKRSSSTNSGSMLMTPELIKQMMLEDELQQQRQGPSSSVKLMTSEEVSKSNRTLSIMENKKSSIDSISMGMTPELIKQMMREEELRQQRGDPNLNPNSSRSTPKLANSLVQVRHLPIDSTSMWMTPTKENLTTIERSGSSSNTPQGSYHVIRDKEKITQESQQDAHLNLGYISESSKCEDYINKPNDIKYDVSNSQPQESKSIQIFKKLPLTLQLIPEEEATHQMSTETKYSQSFGSFSSSPFLPNQLLEPTSLATRLEKLKATKYQTLSSHMLPDILNQVDEPTGIFENGWITIVKDGQASLSIDKKELEMKAKEVESNREIE